MNAGFRIMFHHHLYGALLFIVQYSITAVYLFQKQINTGIGAVDYAPLLKGFVPADGPAVILV